MSADDWNYAQMKKMRSTESFLTNLNHIEPQMNLVDKFHFPKPDEGLPNVAHHELYGLAKKKGTYKQFNDEI